jgi:glycosyltransferase involved in cell wall biosynthesis
MTPRVLLVTRCFWPLTGGTESVMAALGAELHRQQAEPAIVTARWQTDWPSELAHRGVPVARIPHPGSAWRTLRYMLSLGRWLRTRGSRFDLVYVSMLRHDAYSVLTARPRGGWPVVLRAEGIGESSDCAWQDKANFGHRIARTCRTADAIVAPSPIARDELLAAGYPPERLHVIPNGVAIPDGMVDAAARQAARAACAAANEELKLPEGAPLAVCTSRLLPGKGLETLVTAWRAVAKEHRHARLWLVGAGALEDDLDDQIKQAGLTGRVVLAGAFDAVDGLLQAADVFVLPAPATGLSMSLLEALATGLPVVAADNPGNRLVIEDGRHGLLVPPGDAAALAAGISGLLGGPARGAALAAAGRARVSREFNLGKMVAGHVALFQELTRGM